MIEMLAHRTWNPPNSLTGIVCCMAQGASAVECDVRFSIDGEPFLWNDEMQSIFEQPSVRISALRACDVKQLRRLDCPEGIQHVDMLWKILEVYPECVLYIDLKYYERDMVWYSPCIPESVSDVMGYFTTIPDKLVELAMDRIVKPCPCKDRIGFTTFRGGMKLLEAAKKEDARIATDYIVIFPWEHIGKRAKFLSSITIGWKKVNHWDWKIFRGSASRIMREARCHGLKVYAGLANTQQEMAWAVANKANGIWADDISLLADFLRRENSKIP